MDQIDINILNYLKQNGRASASEISKKVNLSIPAVSERIKKLEENKIIDQYTVKINKKKMGYALHAIIFVSLSDSSNITNFRNLIIEYPEVTECHHIAGEYDYMLKIILKDTDELENFLGKKLKSIQGVKNTNTIIILSTLKETVNR
jgi:Lrp/AsnC family leucine-responsive transcriptional regulator